MTRRFSENFEGMFKSVEHSMISMVADVVKYSVNGNIEENWRDIVGTFLSDYETMKTHIMKYADNMDTLENEILTIQNRNYEILTKLEEMNVELKALKKEVKA